MPLTSVRGANARAMLFAVAVPKTIDSTGRLAALLLDAFNRQICFIARSRAGTGSMMPRENFDPLRAGHESFGHVVFWRLLPRVPSQVSERLCSRSVRAASSYGHRVSREIQIPPARGAPR